MLIRVALSREDMNRILENALRKEIPNLKGVRAEIEEQILVTVRMDEGSNAPE
jgi:hypothetical protein